MSPSQPLMEDLRRARAALRDAFLVEVTARIPFYRDLPADMRTVMADRLVDLFLEMLEEYQPAVVRTWAMEVFSRRKEQGATLEELLLAGRILRRVFKRAVLDAARDLAEAAVFLERVDGACDDMTEVGTLLYQNGSDAEARAAEQALDARYEALYLRTPAIMHASDAQLRLIAVSDRWLEVLGYTRDEVLGRLVLDFLTEESRRIVRETGMPRMCREGKLVDLPLQFVKKNREVLDMYLSGIALLNEKGEPFRFNIVLQDITERLQAERAQRESEERWRTLAELAPLPLVVHRQGVFIWANAATARLLAAEGAEDLVGMNALDIVHPEDRALVLARIRQGQQDDEALPPMEQRYLKFDGSVIHVEVAAQPILFGGERATQIALVDVTARKKAEEAERRAAAQAEVIRAQEDMLRALSTPLIPLGEGAIVMPLVGRVTGERAERILETLAEGVVAQGARVAIVDVTGVPAMDAAVADALVRAAQAIRLLGAKVVLTGLGPGAARTLVEMGADLGGIATRATLRDGILHALGRAGAVRSERLDPGRRAR